MFCRLPDCTPEPGQSQDSHHFQIAHPLYNTCHFVHSSPGDPILPHGRPCIPYNDPTSGTPPDIVTLSLGDVTHYEPKEAPISKLKDFFGGDEATLQFLDRFGPERKKVFCAIFLSGYDDDSYSQKLLDLIIRNTHGAA